MRTINIYAKNGRNIPKALWVWCLLIGFLITDQSTGGVEYIIPHSTISCGGGTSSSGSFTLMGTIGQPIVGSEAVFRAVYGGQFGLSSGFWPGPVKPVPDLIWTNVDYSPKSLIIGDALRLIGSYKNTDASILVPNFKIGWEITKNSIVVKSGNFDSGGLPPGGSGEFDFASGYVFVPSSYMIRFTLDVTNQVVEVNETNNSATIEFSIEIPPAGLQNGGFESWTEGISSMAAPPDPSIPAIRPTYWTLGTGIVRRSTGHTGSYSAQLGGKTETEAGWNQKVELIQFITFGYSSFTVMFYAYGGNLWGPFTARVEVIWYDANGNLLSATSLPIAASASWRSYQFTANAPSGAVYAKINLVKASWGYVVFDDIVAGGPPF